LNHAYHAWNVKCYLTLDFHGNSTKSEIIRVAIGCNRKDCHISRKNIDIRAIIGKRANSAKGIVPPVRLSFAAFSPFWRNSTSLYSMSLNIIAIVVSTIEINLEGLSSSSIIISLIDAVCCS